ncbi:transforming growth factor-beta-induced protein ig-h3 [Patella vulgata]|uniref:transforming growth factor-beta-induced protein ig-h3 n=1 Tax=Patella vulgata TaxID=6465 RepID=UPI00217F9F2C|nr:transforming growth factor-beta-induced protein ig-h3 [Patella vulgata]
MHEDKVAFILFVFLIISSCLCHSSPVDIWRIVLEPQNIQHVKRSRIRLRATQDIPHLAVHIGLSDLASFIYRAGLTDTLSSKGPFTVFGPSDLAFFQLPPESRKVLFTNNTLLKELLEYHVVKGSYFQSQFKNEELLDSLLPGYKIRINKYKKNTVTTASGAPLYLQDQIATNGIIQSLTSVMIPPAGTITYFVKTMSAFSILLKAVSVAGLADILNGAGPFTLFAPSDEAFFKLPSAELDKLLNDPKLIKNILLYHTLKGTVYSAGLTNGETVQTISNMSINITITSQGVEVNDAMVTMPDITVTNGAVHVINAVLLPSNLNSVTNDRYLHFFDNLNNEFNIVN